MPAPRSRLLIAVALTALFAAPLSAQLNGLYTCAKGNPGNAFDFGDIGDFFNALEAQGVNGPVTLDIYDDGGPFTSTASYSLGEAKPIPVAPFESWGVVGVGAANPLVIRAALGEKPEITGSGVHDGGTANPAGGLRIVNLSFVTVEGLTVRNCLQFGMRFGGHGTNPAQLSNLRIAGCRVYDVADGCGIGVANDAFPTLSCVDFVIIENNMVWNCGRTGPAPPGVPCVVNCGVGLEWIIRHNTVLHLDATKTNDHAWAFSGLPVEQFHSNITYISSSVVPDENHWAGAFQPLPVFADHNVWFVVGTAWFMGNPALPGTYTFAQWQALGYDANGIVADPMFVSIAPGLEDLHLQPGSPAINRSPLNTVPIDIDGDPRPFGPARDSGADEFVLPTAQLEYAAAPVAHNGAVAIGNVPVGGGQFAFTIRNLGPGPLHLTGTPPVALATLNNCHGSMAVQVQPAPTVLAVNAAATFFVFVRAAVPGALSFQISFTSTDPVQSPYIVTVNATGLAAPPPNLEARADAPAGSSFAGPQNGPYQLAILPGTALANANIALTDPEADSITILSITPPATPLAGVSGPATGIPAHPRTLTWLGTISAATVPGSYTWTIQFRDAVNQSLITISATIQVANLPPVHNIAGAQGGDGSQGNPYQCGFNRGDDGAASVGLCTVTDPNVGQTPFISQTIKAGTNPGTVNFAFALNAGLLNVAPAAMLTVAEAGQHDYEVRVSDGTNLVGIFVVIVVANTPMNFTTASQLPAGETGTAYTAGLAVTGAIGAVGFTVTSGQLPDGIALDAGTGQISGTPTQAEAANFTVEAADATGATASRAFQLAVTDPPTPPGPNPRAEGSDGCAARAGGYGWLALAPVLPALLRRRPTESVRAPSRR